MDAPLSPPAPHPMANRLGRRASLDLRDHRYALPASRGPVGITTRTWYNHEVWDQGDSPQCVAYSSLMFLRAGPVRNLDLSSRECDPFYKEAQKVDEFPGEDYDGTSVRAMFKVLQGKGYVPSYNWAWDVPTCTNWILSKGPMVFGTIWTNQMFEPDAKGFISVGEEAPVGGHAFLIIGANTRLKCPDGTSGAFRMQNSWGEGWGDKGRAWIPFSQAKILLSEDGEAVCANEVVLKGKPKA